MGEITMNLTKLFEMQRELDKHINQEHPQQSSEDRLSKKLLALLVEIGELANELPEVFKYWSNKKNNREKALKEYVDCLHFILSIGLELEVETIKSNHIWNPMDATDTFRTVFSLAAKPINVYSQETKDDWFQELATWFIELGETLEFSWLEVTEAYRAKNVENHQRQESGY
jgi:dimeric dUTPase (all-alpha-NTP-PPase superfamily)